MESARRLRENCARNCAPELRGRNCAAAAAHRLEELDELAEARGLEAEEEGEEAGGAEQRRQRELVAGRADAVREA